MFALVMKSGIFNLWAQMYRMYVLCIDKERFSGICFIFLSLFFCIPIFLWFSWILLKREIPDGLWLFYYLIVCVVNSCWLPTGHCWSKWANISDGSHQQTKWTWWCSSQVLHQLKIFTKLTCHNMYLYLY